MSQSRDNARNWKNMTKETSQQLRDMYGEQRHVIQSGLHRSMYKGEEAQARKTKYLDFTAITQLQIHGEIYKNFLPS